MARWRWTIPSVSAKADAAWACEVGWHGACCWRHLNSPVWLAHQKPVTRAMELLQARVRRSAVDAGKACTKQTPGCGQACCVFWYLCMPVPCLTFVCTCCATSMQAWSRWQATLGRKTRSSPYISWTQRSSTPYQSSSSRQYRTGANWDGEGLGKGGIRILWLSAPLLKPCQVARCMAVGRWLMHGARVFSIAAAACTLFA